MTTTTTEPAPAAGAADERLWWRRPFRMFQTNLREIDAGLDAERVAGQIAEYGANAWLLSVGGIISNYPSRLPFQSPNPALAERESGDLVGDAIAAGREHGVRVLARMDFSKIARPIAEAHPEWCFVAPDGSRQVYQGLTSVCPNGEYYQERIFDVLGEILGSYEIDGFFFNWMSFNEVDYEKRYRGVCQCVACRAAFTAATGIDRLPTGPDDADYQTWQRFTARVLDDLLARVREFIAARRPQAPLIMGQTADIVFHEANNAIGRELWPDRTAEQISLSKSARPEVPVLVNAAAFVDMPYRIVSEDPHHYEQYLVQTISRGAIPSTYWMGTPDEFPYAAREPGSRIARFYRDNEDVYDRLEPAALTAIVRPSVLGHDLTGATPSQSLEEYRGVWTALSAGHVAADVLDAGRIAAVAESGRLDAYRLLVLPDCADLDDGAIAALDAWVERGGRLLLTGESGLGPLGPRLAASGVGARLATFDTKDDTWSSVVLREAGERASALPIFGAFTAVRPAEDAEVAGSVLSKAPYGPPEKCYGHLPLSHPAILRRRVGAGATTTLPWTPGRAYRALGLGALSDLLVDEANALLGEDAVRTDLPAQVEVVDGRSAAGRVVHLRNRSGERHQGFDAPVRVAPGHRLRVPGVPAGARARALVAGTDHPVDADGSVELPAIGAFEVLVLA